MKTKIAKIIIICIAVIMLFSIPMHLKDGGSVEYKSLTYTVTKYHRLSHTSLTGYDVGWGVKILGMTVYENIYEEFVDC